MNLYGKALKEWGHGRQVRAKAAFRHANKARWYARAVAGAIAKRGDADADHGGGHHAKGQAQARRIGGQGKHE